MFRSCTELYKTPTTLDIRRNIYHEKGYYVVKNFISKEQAYAVNDRWLSGQYIYHFATFLKNVDVTYHTPNYFVQRPTPDDWAFCCSVWNDPVDELLHSIIVEAQKLRNIIEGRPLDFGMRVGNPLMMQYRLCRTLSSGTVVKAHADFMEEFRADPTGSHAFDPRRCQLTLFLSDYGTHYKDGGFKLTDNSGKQILFGRDVEAQSGDLVIWKYSNVHEVSGVQPLHPTYGFSRIICPLFEGISP